MSEPEAVMVEIGRGIDLNQRGEREAARELFAEIWQRIGEENGDPFHVCALAHSMADVQDDVQDELLWDQRALAAADQVTDERAARAGVTSPVAGFYPSLHLNLGECYRKLGDLSQAREHLQRGQAAVAAVPDNGYGQGSGAASTFWRSGFQTPELRWAVRARGDSHQPFRMRIAIRVRATSYDKAGNAVTHPAAGQTSSPTRSWHKSPPTKLNTTTANPRPPLEPGNIATGKPLGG